MPFDGISHTATALPFTREDYFALLDVTGRMIGGDKKGYIPSDIPPVVSRLGINPDKWIDHIQCFGRSFGGCVGTVHNIQVREGVDVYSGMNFVRRVSRLISLS
jgi:hypothetical protein